MNFIKKNLGMSLNVLACTGNPNDSTIYVPRCKKIQNLQSINSQESPAKRRKFEPELTIKMKFKRPELEKYNPNISIRSVNTSMDKSFHRKKFTKVTYRHMTEKRTSNFVKNNRAKQTVNSNIKVNN